MNDTIINQNTEQQPETTPTPEASGGQGESRMFSQEEVNRIVSDRLARERAKAPDNSEAAELRAALAEAQAKIDAFSQERTLLSMGVGPEDVDYYAFKIGKLVDDKTSFDAAARQYIKEHPPAGTIRVDLAAPLGGSNWSGPTIADAFKPPKI